MQARSFRPGYGSPRHWLCVAILLCSGCDALQQIPFEYLALPKPDRSYLQEDDYRTVFQDSKNPDAIRWLLAHRIENGMSLEEIEKTIGQSGRFEPDDRRLKANSNSYWTSDKTYAFGPDSQGNSYYLVFREKRLVGFDRAQFLDDIPE